ncbi:MAG TPA: DUF3300 domain-containing protein [Stellaceae bacterium]|jgi:hypothetical protein|nr:DUF3300 domain-containing protein [Stellaceae bacterium]
MHRGRLLILAGTLPFLLIHQPGVALAQPAGPTLAEARAALNPAPAQFTVAQLDQMLAPIALYPDQLLTELLMAATFPQQVVDAGKWLQDPANAAVKGDALVAAVQPLPWDASVKSLIAFPQIVMMNDHLDWTEALGVAFANQEIQTMARVQFLRDRALLAGRLRSTPQLRVVRRASEIIIEPTDPAMVYVPVYNPAVVYGAWPDRGSPPVYIPPPPGFYQGEIGAAIGFSVGFGVAAPLWGWGHPDWRRHQIVVDPNRYGGIANRAVDTGNHVTIEHDIWRRTAPVAAVPEAQRPRAAEPAAPLPPGTVHSNVVARPGFAARPGAVQGGAAAAHPGEPPRPAEAAPAPGTPPHPVAVAPHPEPPHAGPMHEPHPGAPAAAVPHPEPPHQEPTHPAAAIPHPEPPHPAAAIPHPEPPYPAAAIPHPEPPHPAAAIPHPEPPHPVAAIPHPEPPHPVMAAPRSEPAPHPAEVHPAAAPPPHPAPPPKGPPGRPGEEKPVGH